MFLLGGRVGVFPFLIINKFFFRTLPFFFKSFFACPFSSRVFVYFYCTYETSFDFHGSISVFRREYSSWRSNPPDLFFLRVTLQVFHLLISSGFSSFYIRWPTTAGAGVVFFFVSSGCLCTRVHFPHRSRAAIYAGPVPTETRIGSHMGK